MRLAHSLPDVFCLLFEFSNKAEIPQSGCGNSRSNPGGFCLNHGSDSEPHQGRTRGAFNFAERTQGNAFFLELQDLGPASMFVCRELLPPDHFVCMCVCVCKGLAVNSKQTKKIFENIGGRLPFVWCFEHTSVISVLATTRAPVSLHAAVLSVLATTRAPVSLPAAVRAEEQALADNKQPCGIIPADDNGNGAPAAFNGKLNR